MLRHVIPSVLCSLLAGAVLAQPAPPVNMAVEPDGATESGGVPKEGGEENKDGGIEEGSTGKEKKTVVRHPKAKSVPLDEPVILEKPQVPEAVEPVEEEPVPGAPAGKTGEQSEPAAEQVEDPGPPEGSLVILRTVVPPSTTTRLSWSPSQSMEGIATPTPVLIVNGAESGPVLCLTAAIHGDELNGIEVVRRVMYNLDPEILAGAVIGVPIVNLQGFHRSSRYLTDRRDLNRFFPGYPTGSSASRIAFSFFEEVIRHCDALVDLHTGSFHRTNMPQLRADLRDPQVVQLTEGFGATVVLQSEGAGGTLRRAAVDAGIPAVTLEAGESMRLQENAVEHGVNGITTLMSKMGMIERFSFWGDPEPVYYNSVWVRADQGGILFSNVELGDTVAKGDLLGEVTDPITNIKKGIVSPRNGRVIGMALNQVVLPGFAAFHIAIQAPKTLVQETAEGDKGEGQDQKEKEAADDAAPVVGNGLQADPDMIDVEMDGSDPPDTDDFD